MTIESSDEEILLTEARAAQILTITVQALQAWRVRHRAGPPYVRLERRNSQGSFRYRAADLETFIESNVRRPGRRE
jgi:hypothetical protein